LEGAARPGHFAGVATVVGKLLNIVQPARVYFGQKDAQQVAVVKTMVRDLSFPVDVVVCPTVREQDGLAMSSRNAYLQGDERRTATVLWRALQAGRRAIQDGEAVDKVELRMRDVISSEDVADIDYAAVVDPDSFGPPSGAGPFLLVLAVRVGKARLIDNLRVEL
jgi:pantoate--beta-alanine ligase